MGGSPLHPEVAQPAVDDAVVAEQHDPGVHADQVVDEPRQDEQHDEQMAHAAAVARDHVGHRIADQQAEHAS